MAPVAKECDYLVIGGGSGGIASARRAAGWYGAKTIVVESKRLGGTCVNVGCVPKKVTWNAASIADTMKDAHHYGFNFQETAPFDFTSFKKKRDAYVHRLNGIYERNLANDKVEYIHGRAHFVNPHEVEVVLDDGSKTTVLAKKILIATGGHPNLPTDIPGYEHGISSDGFFDLDKQPKRIAVIGAGYIAVEMAGMLHALGTDTHLFIRQDTFLRPFDPMIQEEVVREYERQGVKLYKRSKQSKVEPVADKPGWLKLHYSSSNYGEGILEVDTVLWAIGRSAEVEDLGLDKAGVKQQSEKGLIEVDSYQNTSVPHIYALGDVCGLVELTPVAIAAGRKLSDRLFGSQFHAELKDSKLDYTNVPSVVFAHPEVGSIGMTEPAAIEKFGKEGIKIYQSKFNPMLYAVMDDEHKGAPCVYKLICAGPEEKVVGMHIIGMGASEILQGFGVAIKMGATKKDFDSCVAIHPTSAEELVTMK
ncbi:MAG: Glutathione reductase [Watsoniomyces obsoletus]|nr:MAG: Glutathione reductase [Watsoniomyces obsoletus]